MANLHASLDSIRLSQISTRYLVGGVYSTTFDPELRNEVQKFSYVGQGGDIQQLLILNSEMKYLH